MPNKSSPEESIVDQELEPEPIAKPSKSTNTRAARGAAAKKTTNSTTNDNTNALPSTTATKREATVAKNGKSATTTTAKKSVQASAATSSKPGLASIGSAMQQQHHQCTAEYHIERAKHLFGLSLMHCARCGATPKLTQGMIGLVTLELREIVNRVMLNCSHFSDICQQLALCTGNICPTRTANYLNFGVGIRRLVE